MRIIDETTDFELARHLMTGIWGDAVVTLDRGVLFRSQIDSIVLPRLRCGLNATVGGLHIRNMVLESSYLLTIPVEGHSLHEFHGQARIAGGACAVLHSTFRPLSLRTCSNVRSLQVNIDAESVDLAIANFFGSDRLADLGIRNAIDMNADGNRSLKSLAARSIKLLHKPGIIWGEYGLVAKNLENRWIQAIVDQFARNIGNPGAAFDPGEIYVATAEAYIRSHLDMPLSLSDLASHCGISGRSLLAGFRKHRGFSPMHFWREQRFQAAHRELISAEPCVSVTEIALKWGFSHLGRFSEEYRKRFLQAPSEARRQAVSK